jgi:hypothetical protein
MCSMHAPVPHNTVVSCGSGAPTTAGLPVAQQQQQQQQVPYRQDAADVCVVAAAAGG